MARRRPSQPAEALACWRELGAELRKRREKAGLTGIQASREIGWSPGRMSRVESGHLPVSEVAMIQYLACCGVYPRDYGDLFDIWRRAVRNLGYWVSPSRESLGDAGHSMIYHETTAAQAINYEPQVVPGLLQTESYVRALTAERWPEWNLDRAVQIRIDRQQIMHRWLPGRFSFFVHEQALRVVVGDPTVMHEQIVALMLLNSVPHVAVHVLPASAGVHALYGGSFRLFEYKQHQPLVHIDSHFGGFFVDDKSYVASYRQLIPAISDVALTEGESREFLAELANEYERASTVTHVEEEQL